MEAISVVITTHNRCEQLKGALNSVLQQTYSNIEVIVVVDNSTDNTMDYLSTVEDERLKVIFIDEKESRGGNYARNLGIKNSSSEIVAFLDDDDIWYSEKLEKQLQVMIKENCGLVYCGQIDDYNNGELREIVTPADDMKGDLSEKVFGFIFCTTSMIMVKKSLLEQVGYFDESVRFWQEYDLCIRLCQITKVGYVKEPMMELKHEFQDKARLTNNFDNWVEAVKQQNIKYKDLIDVLPEKLKKDRKIMISRDAIMRCEVRGYKQKQRQYLWNIFKLTHNLFDGLRWLFNFGEYKWKLIKRKLGAIK